MAVSLENFEMRIYFLIALLALLSPVRAEVPREYQIKAAFLYNFAKFVQWPASRFTGPESPLVIGVMHGNPFENELKNAVSGRRIHGRPVVVRLVSDSLAARQTHLLFLGPGQESTLAALKGHAVLTVGESAAFAREGGMITFTPQGGTMHFTIDQRAADEAKLRISSQLQKLSLGIRR